MAIPLVLAQGLAKAGIPVVAASLPAVIRAFVATREVDRDVLVSFIKYFGPAVGELAAALEQLSKDQAIIAGRAIEVIKEAVEYCKQHLACCTTAEERLVIAGHVVQLVSDARLIADADRSFRMKMLVTTTGVVCVGVAAIIAVKYPQAGGLVLKRGFRLLR
jgi:hypothetical protein